MRLAKGPLSAHRNCQTSGPRFRYALIRLPCCIPASSVAVAMRKNSYAVSPKPAVRQTVGVNCFAAAMLFEMRRLLFRDTYLFADKPGRNAKACHIGPARIFSQ